MREEGVLGVTDGSSKVTRQESIPQHFFLQLDGELLLLCNYSQSPVPFYVTWKCTALVIAFIKMSYYRQHKVKK